MAYSRQPFHPLPRGPPELGRVELNVLKLDADGNSVYDEDFDRSACNCFPRPSKRTIPSMLYDHINCPHSHHKHIQPAQQYVFTYPWTASSDKHVTKGTGALSDDDSLARLSIIGEEDELESITDSIHVTRTAPPFATHDYTTTRKRAPYTAPTGDETRQDYAAYRRTGSQPSLTGFHRQTPSKRQVEINPTTPYVDYTLQTRRPAQSRDQHYHGHYVDPKDGQVYDFKVKYGKKENRRNLQTQ